MSVWMRCSVIWSLGYFGKLWACSSSYLFMLVLLTGASLQKLHASWRNNSFVSRGLRFVIHQAGLKKHAWRSIDIEMSESTDNRRLLYQSQKSYVTFDCWRKVNLVLFDWGHVFDSHALCRDWILLQFSLA